MNAEEALATALHTANYRVMPCFDRDKPLAKCFLVESHYERAGEILNALDVLGWSLWPVADGAVLEARLALQSIAAYDITGAKEDDVIEACRRMKEIAHSALSAS